VIFFISTMGGREEGVATTALNSDIISSLTLKKGQ